MSQVRVIIENRSPENGILLTPLWVGFHDGSFDLFDTGTTASRALEALAGLMARLDGVAKPTLARVNGPAIGGGVGLVIVWVWNMVMPDQQMTAEVGAAVGGFLGGYLAPVLTALAAWRKRCSSPSRSSTTTSASRNMPGVR